MRKNFKALQQRKRKTRIFAPQICTWTWKTHRAMDCVRWMSRKYLRRFLCGAPSTLTQFSAHTQKFTSNTTYNAQIYRSGPGLTAITFAISLVMFPVRPGAHCGQDCLETFLFGPSLRQTTRGQNKLRAVLRQRRMPKLLWSSVSRFFVLCLNGFSCKI